MKYIARKYRYKRLRFTGLKVPHWEMILEDMVRKISGIPFLEYVGWDIIITEKGYVVIEGNHNPSVRVTQMYFPLLEDERVRQFFSHYGII
jgi:glutathione synthase/RimK-type ligase-like ATP-grasp enzyme